MSETNYALADDLAQAKTMVGGLEDYVRGDQVYGSASGGWLGGDANMPALTIGALLLRLRRLRAQQGSMTDEQKATLAQIEAENRRVHDAWTRRYVDKLQQEAKARLQTVSLFVEDCADDPVSCAGSYTPPALSRTILQDIAQTLGDERQPYDDLDAAMRKEDIELHSLTEPTDFIWSPELQAVYPQAPYWWLYARPRSHQ